MHSEEPPPLPRRTANQAMAATLQLWEDTRDVELLERVVDGLRAYDEPARVRADFDAAVLQLRAAEFEAVRYAC
ncbi:hypothetical protein [Nocardia carnea]|uniref:hypothetical protein n=1 Tax=Nocardia carnea TaxID=37328 RepID=UPI002456BA98|nr:hypothetical protein [Nocardia carnea]